MNSGLTHFQLYPKKLFANRVVNSISNLKVSLNSEIFTGSQVTFSRGATQPTSIGVKLSKI